MPTSISLEQPKLVAQLEQLANKHNITPEELLNSAVNEFLTKLNGSKNQAESIMSEVFTDLSDEELQALAESSLAPIAQEHLNELLARNRESKLSLDEEAELDHLLASVDYLNILKARARLTLYLSGKQVAS